MSTVVDSHESVRIIHGNCLDVLRGMPDASVDAVVTDPPYGMAFQSAWREDKSKRFSQIAGDDAPFVWFLADAARIIKPGGCLICFCRWDSAEAFRLAIGWAGLAVKSQLIWDRVAHGMGDLKSSAGPQHDTIWFATKGKYVFHGARPKSILRHQRPHGDALRHPNEKPLSLMASLVQDYVPPGGTVVDPFAGSGSTGEACVQTGRGFIGIELDPEYCEIARERVNATITQPTTGANT